MLGRGPCVTCAALFRYLASHLFFPVSGFCRRFGCVCCSHHQHGRKKTGWALAANDSKRSRWCPMGDNFKRRRTREKTPTCLSHTNEKSAASRGPGSSGVLYSSRRSSEQDRDHYTRRSRIETTSTRMSHQLYNALMSPHASLTNRWAEWHWPNASHRLCVVATSAASSRPLTQVLAAFRHSLLASGHCCTNRASSGLRGSSWPSMACQGRRTPNGVGQSDDSLAAAMSHWPPTAKSCAACGGGKRNSVVL